MATRWVVLKVRARLRRGWEVFEDTRGLHWVRRRDDTGEVLAFEEEDITAEEEIVLDDVLKEEMDRES